MKQIQTVEKGTNFSAANFGRLADIKDYVLNPGPEIKIPGKVFGGHAVGATGGEFSFQGLHPDKRPDSCTPTRVTRNCIFSSPAKVNFRLTEKSSRWKKAA